MVTILEFRRPEGLANEPQQKPDADGQHRTAEIIIFPGVRIERAPAQTAVEDAQSRPSAKGSGRGTARQE